jgi:hypothetical protein
VLYEHLLAFMKNEIYMYLIVSKSKFEKKSVYFYFFSCLSIGATESYLIKYEFSSKDSSLEKVCGG